MRGTTIWDKTLGPEHPSLATALSNLGLIFYEWGQYGQADGCRRAQAIREKALGKDHLLLAESLVIRQPFIVWTAGCQLRRLSPLSLAIPEKPRPRIIQTRPPFSAICR